MLLKSIPATQGMTRPQLFQFVEPNAHGAITLATYQAADKALVEARKTTLEKELRQVLDDGEDTKLFKDPNEGMWFGSVLKQKNGRISAQNQNKLNIDHINRLNELMQSPPHPKKRTSTNISNPQNISSPRQHPAWSHAVPNPPTQPTTHSHSLNETNTSKDRILHIEQELVARHERNKIFDSRITGLENTTLRIDSNVAAILSKLDSINNTPAKLRKTSATSSHRDTDIHIDSNLTPDHYLTHHEQGFPSP
jgi:hypothetical protein